MTSSDAAQSLNDLLAANTVRTEHFLKDMERLVPSEKNYVILFTPRSGSSFLTAMLAETGVAGHPDEWFNPNWIVKVAHKFNARDIDSYIDMLKRRKKTLNGVFGVELTFFHYEKLAGCTDFFAHFPNNCPYFLLVRQDIILQAISLFKAVESGLFHSVSTSAEQRAQADLSLQYDGDRIAEWIRHIRRQEEGCLALVREHDLNVKFLSYESMFATGTRELVTKLFDHIGLAVPVVLPVKGGPRHHKISTILNEEFKQRFVLENKEIVSALEEDRRGLLNHFSSGETDVNGYS